LSLREVLRWVPDLRAVSLRSPALVRDVSPALGLVREIWSNAMPHFDAIVIGSGQAGPSLTARLTSAGMSVGFIEREHFGGTCVNDGCTPTKALVASAQVAHVARRAGDYGVRVPPPIEVDMRAVKARKDAISGRSRIGVENWLRGMRGCTIFWGQGLSLDRRKSRSTVRR
jgi:pyruvate/2-oxoglutarate dehydrogenase complex dihydrolipoamide dehydrogenase (E3) component